MTVLYSKITLIRQPNVWSNKVINSLIVLYQIPTVILKDAFEK